MDLYNREIIGYAADKHKDVALVYKTFTKSTRSLENIKILHTDRGDESSDGIAKKANNLSKDINKYDNKLSKLVELYIDGIITKEEYEKNYTHVIKKLERLKEKQQNLESDYKEQKDLKKKINSF